MVVQKTYSMIKPDAMSHKADIVKLIEKAKFKIVDSKEMEISRELAEEFYAEHQGKSFFDELIEYITSAPVFAMILEKDNAIADFRTFIGSTDPKKAAPKTIRKLYGKDISHNAIHGSDAPESAEREIGLIFGSKEETPEESPEEASEESPEEAPPEDE
jgi:nucleoside-diphosphate kinase